MGAAPKYKNYPRESTAPSESSSRDPEIQKKEIEILKKKIEQLLRDPQQQKKAAKMIEDLLKHSK